MGDNGLNSKQHSTFKYMNFLNYDLEVKSSQ